jgi:hypothetical protein
MSLRAAALYKGNRVLNIVIQVFAYTVLLAGVGVATFREYLTYAHYGNEDKVMGGARTTTGAFSNLFSSICQILFAFLFFYQLARFLMAETPKEKRQKKIILVSAVVECILILGCTIYYAIARPLGYKTASAILPLIAAMSCKFMLDFGILN